MQTIGAKLDRQKGFGPGFEFLRIGLAVSVLWFHSFVVIGAMPRLEATPAWYYIYAIMPMFFALSGFLIAGSADRLSLGNFLINRGLRIVPALAVEICLSALLLGLFFTTLSPGAYLTQPQFWHYFTNIFGWIQYQLPGVFAGLPSDGVVNQSLWTVPFEIGCYVLISLVIVFQLGRHLAVIIAVILIMLLVPTGLQLASFVRPDGKTAYGFLNYLLFSRGSLLFPSFLLGALGYWLRHRLPYSPLLAGALTLLCLGLAIIGRETWRQFYALNLISVPLFVYLTIFIGTSALPKIPFYRRGDYSYGIYLYGYPLQQSLVTLWPSLMSSWLYHFTASLLAATAMAVFSWHLIEKPILLQRKRFSFIGRKVAAEASSDGPSALKS